jgi:hypothetical protein
MAQKRKSSRRVATVREDNYTALEQYAIALNEYYKALRKAGFSVELALGILSDKDSYPGWILPEPVDPNKIGSTEYEDDDDE